MTRTRNRQTDDAQDTQDEALVLNGVTIDPEGQYSVDLRAGIRVGRSIIRPANGVILKGRVLIKEAPNGDIFANVQQVAD